jgi:hypothetical protein
MKDSHTLIAFMATLCAIVVLVGMALIALARGQSLEAVGIGGAVTGLIGVLGTFKPRTTMPDTPQSVNVVNTPSAPLPVEEV